MAPRVVSLQEQISTTNGNTKCTVNLTLTDSLKLSLWHFKDHLKTAGADTKQLGGVTVSGPSWSIRRTNFPAQGTKLKARRGDWRVSQYVPGNAWYMAPNPSIQVVKKGLGDKDTVVTAKHNFLRRRSTLAGALYGGNDRCYKAGVRLDSVTNLNREFHARLHVRAKLREQLLHSVSASLDSVHGPTFSCKSKPLEGAKLKATWDPNLQKVFAALSFTPAKTGSQATLTANAVVPVTGQRPSAVVGMKWRF